MPCCSTDIQKVHIQIEIVWRLGKVVDKQNEEYIYDVDTNALG